jgi:hypothetical protein
MISENSYLAFFNVHGSVHRNNILLYNSNKMHKSHCLSNLSVRHPQHTQTGSNSSTIAADSSNGVKNTKCYRYSCTRS